MSIIGNAVTLGGGGEPELLWTNPAPTASFAPQNVTVSGDYDGYIVEVVFNALSGQYTNQILVPNIINASTPTDGFFLCITKVYSGTTIHRPAYRRINSLNNGAFAFGEGKAQLSESYSTYNQYAVPIRIWGVKWTI